MHSLLSAAELAHGMGTYVVWSTFGGALSYGASPTFKHGLMTSAENYLKHDCHDITTLQQK